MKTKLEFTDIAGNLPHGLKMCEVTEDGFTLITQITGIQSLQNWRHVFLDHDDRVAIKDGKVVELEYSSGGYSAELGNFSKPILRPVSDLYETIKHNGEEIIPIVELAKIHDARPQEWELNSLADRAQLVEHKMVYFFFGSDADFHSGSSRIGNQPALWDFMHELKIDYRGLIGAGLAISVHDIPIPVYE